MEVAQYDRNPYGINLIIARTKYEMEREGTSFIMAYRDPVYGFKKEVTAK